MSVNPGARGNEVSPLPRQMVLGIVNVIQAWQMTEIYDITGKHLPVTASVIVRWRGTAEPTPLRSMFFRKVVEGKDAIWKVKSDFRHLSIRKHFTFNLVFHFFLNYDNLHRDKSSL